MALERKLIEVIGYIRLDQMSAYEIRFPKESSYKRSIDADVEEIYRENPLQPSKPIFLGTSFTGSSSTEARKVGKLFVDAFQAGYHMAQYYLEVDLISAPEKAREFHDGFMEMVSDILNSSDSTKVIVIGDMKTLSVNEAVQRVLIQYLASKGITLIHLQRKEQRTLSEERRVIAKNRTDEVPVEVVEAQALLTQCDKTVEYFGLVPADVEAFKETGKRPVGRKSYHKDRPELVLKISKYYRKHKGQKKPSYQDVADRLNAEGERTISGKPFIRQNIKKILEDPKTKLLAHSRVDSEKFPSFVRFEMEKIKKQLARERPDLVGDAEMNGAFAKEFERAKKKKAK